MYWKEDVSEDPGCSSMIVGSVLLCLLAGFIWFQAHQEAKAFNRCTDSNVTTWEAIWAEYRIIGCK